MVNKKQVDSTRNQLVVKSNEIIQKARFNFTIEEQKIIAYLVSKVKPEDSFFEPFNFSVQDFCEVCGISSNGGSVYKHIKDTLKRLSDKSIWVKTGKKGEVLVRLLQRIELDEYSSSITVRFDEMMVPYLLYLREQFTQYQLRNVIAMESKYSPRLYELLKSYEGLHKPITFDIEYLKEKFFAQTYDRYPDFKRKVIDMAVSEINRFTDIIVTYVTEKDGRKVARIVFTIQRKDSIENLYAVVEQEKRL